MMSGRFRTFHNVSEASDAAASGSFGHPRREFRASRLALPPGLRGSAKLAKT